MSVTRASKDPASGGPPSPSGRGRPHALRAVARFHGREVEEVFARAGAPITLGGTDLLAIPVPEGAPFVARCEWRGPAAVRVTDGLGRVHELVPDGLVSLRLGAVEIELSLVRRFSLSRLGESRWWEGLPFLSAVLAFNLVVAPSALFMENRCEWMGGFSPQLDRALRCEAHTAGGGISGSHVTAEYLARLLREDFAGAEEGIIDEIDREQGERESPSFYMPAGAEGPITEMGGAEDVGPEEIRAPQLDEDEVIERSAADPDSEPLLAAEQGAPMDVDAGATEDDTIGDDGLAEAEADAPEDPEAEVEASSPQEDKEGWGVQDWYDERDRVMEHIEIDMMMRFARERLRIDPNDPDALSVLSYYQYLSEDYEAALATYDKYIAALPESSAGYNNKALIYKRQGDYQTEERLYRIALALAPDDVTALNNLAVCLAHQKRFDEALEIMARLETLDPGDPYADLHRAKIYAEMGERELVYEHLERSLVAMAELDTLHHIEFRQDIRVDPSFESMRRDPTFRAILIRYYGKESPLQP